jgi:mannose/fructose/N-acetylgalactosamine-specific phosphotransferase system component IIC
MTAPVLVFAALVPFVLLGAVCGLDVVSFPQAMISRPIVAATAAGALAGSASLGLVTGVALELIALETLPFGASRYPEWGSASVVGGTLAAFGGLAHSAGAVPIAMLAALVTAWAGGWTMIGLRRWNAARARRHVQTLDAGAASTIVGLQLWGLTADFFRAAALTLLGLVALQPVAAVAARHWAVDPRTSRAIIAVLAATVALAAAWKIFHTIAGARWLFCCGLVVGVGLLFWR